MNAVVGESGAGETAEGGPMWGRFFDSIGQEDTESALSGSHMRSDQPPSARSLQQVPESPHSEVHPNDSASAIDDDSAVGDPERGAASVTYSSSALPIDDGTYVFKFSTPSSRTHRFQSRHDNIEHLREIVMGKLATDPFFTDFKPIDGSDLRPDPIDFHLSYTDADGDIVFMASDSDVTDAVKIARAKNLDRVVLFVQGGKGWTEAIEATKVKTPSPLRQEVKEEKSENVETQPLPTPSEFPPLPSYPGPTNNASSAIPDEIMGIPKDLLLPASIGALAVVIIGIFTISRMTSSNY
jgi:hypothetical protein